MDIRPPEYISGHHYRDSTVFSIGTPEAVLHGKRLPCVETANVGLEATLQVFSVHAFGPTVSQFLFMVRLVNSRHGLLKKFAEPVSA
jgi:hypothetical protein